MKRNLTCIVCPMGCELEVIINDKGEVENVSGNTCKRGEVYAKAECTNPMRTITTTALCENGEVVSVKTSKAIPKSKMFDCMKIINNLKIQLPISIGCVIIENILDTGADIVVTSNKGA